MIRLGRWGAAIFGLLALWGVTVSALAQEDAAEEPWQAVITAQIEAFRAHDAPAAFSYAGSGFQLAFQNAEVFFEAIVSSGYAPIMESTSHSFGGFRLLGDRAVVQEVRFMGPDQQLYGAIYQLTEEEAGWRVQGVQLFRQPGVAV